MKKSKKRVLSKKVEAHFEKKDRIKKRRKFFFMSLVFLVSGVIFLFKAPMFRVNGFTVSGNKMIKKEGILNKNLITGKNIFLLDTNTVKSEILKNPYIQTAEVSRVLPNQLNLKVTERKMFYKLKVGKKSYILNNELYIMDVVTDDRNLSLVEIDGIKPDSKEVGKKITLNDKLSEIAFNIANNLIDKNKDSIFTKLDLKDTGDISIYKNKVEIILGEPNNLENKYKKAMEILSFKDIALKEGYINVSVPSQPVIKNIEEKKKDDKMNEIIQPSELKNKSEEEVENEKNNIY